MKLEKLFEQTVNKLSTEKCQYAICGGIAAIAYRNDTRYTGDIDVLISASSKSAEIGKKIVEEFGFTADIIRLAQISSAPMMNKKSSPVAIIIGRSKADKSAPGLDFLMPVFPWAQKAIERAQENVLSIGRVKAPFVTAEDVILAKLHSFGAPNRAKDWDDIQAIFRSGRNLDFDYLAGEVTRQKLYLNKHLEKELPKELAACFKRIRCSQTDLGR